MRGPSWLAWLSLLFATQIAAADPVVGFDADDSADRGEVHAIARPRPWPVLTSGAQPTAASEQGNLSGSPAVAVVTFMAPLPVRRVPRPAVRHRESSSTPVRVPPRAPPFSPFLYPSVSLV